jgi:hypothetical protein
MTKEKLYSPDQITVSAFIGGPLAAVFTLWKNFESLGNKSHAQQTLIGGGLFIIALMGSTPFLPDWFPLLALPVTYIAVARLVAEKFQMSKAAIIKSSKFELQTNVLWISIGFMFAFIVIFLLWLILLVNLGWFTITS